MSTQSLIESKLPHRASYADYGVRLQPIRNSVLRSTLYFLPWVILIVLVVMMVSSAMRQPLTSSNHDWMLVGRLTEKVTQFGHDRLTVFGIGKDLNEKQWRAVIRQLVAMGHLRADSEAFGALKLTESARGVLKGETEVMLREAAPGTRVRTNRAKSRRGDLAPGAETKPADAPLQAALRAWRADIARQRSVPAYVVLHDSTIDGIAAARPSTLNALRNIPGIGDKKLEHYGDELLALVRAAEA